MCLSVVMIEWTYRNAGSYALWLSDGFAFHPETLQL